MTGLFSVQRRADEFEALLTRGPATPLTDREVERFASLLAVVSDLRALPEATPRVDFSATLRERLMAEADSVLLPLRSAPLAPPRLAMPPRGRDRRLAALLGGAAVVGATATMAVAAQTALPGESLYSVKRGIEAAELRFADGDADRGRALLANAETRLDELEALTAQAGASTRETVPDTLDTFTDQSGEGVRHLLTAYAQSGSEADVERAREFTAASLERLGALEVPDSARDELVSAGRTLTDLDLEAAIACPSCDGGITTVPDFLLASAPTDLTAGLDVDDQTLEAAPVSGQDVAGVTVPQDLLPDLQPTQQTLPSAIPTPTPTKQVTEPVKETTDGVTEPVEEPVTEVTEALGDPTGEVTQTVEDVTGGAVGGLTGEPDDATGALIGEVTGSVGAVSDVTGVLLP